MASRTLYRALWIPSAVVLVGMTIMYAKQPETLPIPDAPKTFTTEDRTLTVAHPGNWKPRQTSMNAVLTQVQFDPSRNVRCVIQTDLTGSLLADISRTPSSASDSLAGLAPGMEQTARRQKTPLETVHAAQGHLLEKEYRDRRYEEGETRPLQAA